MKLKYDLIGQLKESELRAKAFKANNELDHYLRQKELEQSQEPLDSEIAFDNESGIEPVLQDDGTLTDTEFANEQV